MCIRDRFWEEVILSHSVVGVIDFTPGAGYLAEACLAEKVPYVGFVQTTTTERAVRRYLFKRMWGLMCTPGSAHYAAALRELVAEAAASPPAAAAAKAAGGGAPQNGAGSSMSCPAAKAAASGGGAPAGGANPALLQALKAL